MDTIKIIKVTAVIITLLLACALKAQNSASDTLYFKGDYIVKCACTKKKKAVIDIESKNDTTVVTRLIFDQILNENMIKIEEKDTIPLDIGVPNTLYHYATQYYTVNVDGVRLFVYQPAYKNRLKRIFKLDGKYFRNYHISNKCPRSIMRKKCNFQFWR